MAQTGEFYEVNVANTPTHHNPPICVSCGAPAGMSTHTVGSTKKSGTMRYEVSYTFPLCPECGIADDRSTKLMGRSLFIAAPIAVIALAVVLCNYSKFQNEDVGAYVACGTVLAGIGLFFGLRWLLTRLLMNKEDRERSTRIDRSVKIKAFGPLATTLQFRNQEFGRLYEEANKNPPKEEMDRLLGVK